MVNSALLASWLALAAITGRATAAAAAGQGRQVFAGGAEPEQDPFLSYTREMCDASRTAIIPDESCVKASELGLEGDFPDTLHFCLIPIDGDAVRDSWIGHYTALAGDGGRAGPFMTLEQQDMNELVARNVHPNKNYEKQDNLQGRIGLIEPYIEKYKALGWNADVVKKKNKLFQYKVSFVPEILKETFDGAVGIYVAAAVHVNARGCKWVEMSVCVRSDAAKRLQYHMYITRAPSWSVKQAALGRRTTPGLAMALHRFAQRQTGAERIISQPIEKMSKLMLDAGFKEIKIEDLPAELDMDALEAKELWAALRYGGPLSMDPHLISPSPTE